MIPLIKIEPFSNCNDSFASPRNLLDFTPIPEDITHEILVQDRQNFRNKIVNGGIDHLNLPSSYYKRIALDIVNESLFHHPYPYITEKTIRCIINKRMFVLLAPAGTLAYIKSLGVQTFDDIIDESYDSELDPELRLLKLADTVRSFCTIPIEDVKTYYQNNRDKFEHNANVFYNIQQQELERLKQEVRT